MKTNYDTTIATSHGDTPKNPYVISISGVSGSGKTTAANKLKALLTNAEIVCFDDFPGDLLGRDYCEWSESGGYCDAWNLSAMTERLDFLLTKPINYIIIDYPFGKSHSKVSKYIDLSVWLDIPLDVSLAKRVLRDFTRRSPSRRPLKRNAADEISAYLDFYLARHRDTYLTHIKTVRPFVDVVADGTETPDEIADEIMKFII